MQFTQSKLNNLWLSTDFAANKRQSLQERIGLELDEGISDIYSISNQYKMCRTHPLFINEIADYYLDANSKAPLTSQTLKNNKDKLVEVLTFAAEQHAHQDRESGYPYVAHAFSTGYPLARFGLPFDVIVAGINHDVPEESLNKGKAIQKLYTLNPLALFYVLAVSAKPIEEIGLEHKDTHLHNQIEEFSAHANNPFPKLIKYFDNTSNLFDLWGMGDKNGMNPKQRREKFIGITINKIMIYAEQIDKTPYIQLTEGPHTFSLKKYLQEKVDNAVNTYNLNVGLRKTG